MRQTAENQLKKIVSLLAGSIALIVIFSLPLTYYFVQYNNLSNNLQYKANLLASDVSQYVFQHPESWGYQEERLVGFLERNVNLDREQIFLISEAFEISISSGMIERSPALLRQAIVTDGISEVAVVQIQTSSFPLLLRTFYSFLFSLCLGLMIFITLYFWPLKALKQAISELENVRLKLVDEVSEKNELLDVSAQLAANLKSQRDFTDTIFEVANNIIVVLDLDGCFVRFNRAAEEISGYSRDEVLGRPVWECVIPEENKKVVKDIFKNFGNSELSNVEHFESEWVKRQGGCCTLECSKSALYDKAGNVTHVVILGYDITQRKAAEVQEQRLQRELNQARKMEALGQLTGGIAHDFNNMLGIIIGYSDLALNQLKNSEQATIKKYLDNIFQSGKRASDLVKQMMVFSRKDPGQSEIVNFEQITGECIKMLRSVMPSSIKINVEFESQLPDIKMDAVQLQQIMMNLFLNAKDAMEGEGTIDIKLGWHHELGVECIACHKLIDGDWLELSVTDTGHGIDGRHLARIFEPFFTTKEVGKGTGLGLSMIHTLVENHHGHMLIETEVGKGSTFRLLFPPYTGPAAEIESVPDEQKILQNLKGHGEKILLVDDESSLASFVESVLKNNGYQCDAQIHSPEALELFNKDPEAYSLVMTDQTMPEMTGVDLIAEIRKLRPGLPAILMTGYSEVIDKEEASRQGIAYINKPFNTQALLNSVADSLKNVKN